NIGRDAELITDPSFTFTVSPPVRWTYYPPIAPTGGTTISNFLRGSHVHQLKPCKYAQNDRELRYSRNKDWLPRRCTVYQMGSIVTQQQATATTCPLSTTMIQAGIGPYQEYTKTLTVSDPWYRVVEQRCPIDITLERVLVLRKFQIKHSVNLRENIKHVVSDQHHLRINKIHYPIN
ncbi:hypothetical protein COOONC_07827, partial [Cooperia oncophora]